MYLRKKHSARRKMTEPADAGNAVRFFCNTSSDISSAVRPQTACFAGFSLLTQLLSAAPGRSARRKTP